MLLSRPARDPRCPSRARPRASGTSGRSRSAATRCASSPASSPRSGSASGAGSPAAAAPGEISDIAIWAVPFGLVGGRLYHVITDCDLYFGEGKHPVERALRLARRPRHLGRDRARAPSARCIGARRKGIKLLPVLDALAPGVLVAQAIGRWGNWFNQELFGRPTDLPWGLEIDDDAPPSTGLPAGHDLPPDVPLRVPVEPGGLRGPDLGRTGGSGSATAGWSALYVMIYTPVAAGSRYLRIDNVELNDVWRPAAQRVDLDRALRRRRWSASSGQRAAPARPRGAGVRRRPAAPEPTPSAGPTSEEPVADSAGPTA